MDTEAREFPLADILSVTTPRLLSRRRMDGVCELVDWITFSAPTPQLINLKVWGSFKLRAKMARTSLLRQFPQLEEVQPATDCDQLDLIAWLVEQERVHGTELTVSQADVEMRAMFDATLAALKPVAKFLKDTFEAMAPTMRSIGALVTQLAQAEAELCEADRTLPEHPDLAELDVQLRGYYGDA